MKKYLFLIVPLFFIAAFFTGRMVYAAVVHNASFSKAAMTSIATVHVSEYTSFTQNLPEIIDETDKKALLEEIADYMNKVSFVDIHGTTTPSQEVLGNDDPSALIRKGSLLSVKISLLRSIFSRAHSTTTPRTAHPFEIKKINTQTPNMLQDLAHQIIALESLDVLPSLQNQINIHLFPERKNTLFVSGHTFVRKPSHNFASSTRQLFLGKKKIKILDDTATSTASTSPLLTSTTTESVATTTATTSDTTTITPNATTTDITASTTPATTEATSTPVSNDPVATTSPSEAVVPADPPMPPSPPEQEGGSSSSPPESI